MKQSKLESAVEIALNTASGFVLSWACYEYIVIPYMHHMVAEALWATILFTVISLVRSYVWRRFFATGLHHALHDVLRGFTGWGNSTKPAKRTR